MARLIERTFDPAAPLVVRRFFTAAGRHFNPGDDFDWRRLSVDQRRTRLLFEAGKLMHPQTVQHEMEDKGIPRAAAADAPETPPTPPLQEVPRAAEADGLDDLNIKELRAIAEAEGAPFRVSREAQREAIRARRSGAAG
jgi:hypothetical protein